MRERANATARQNRRLRWLLVGLVGLLALTFVAGLVAVLARRSAEDNAAAARRTAITAEARPLASDALNADRPELGLLEAVEAVRREASPETYGALLTLLTRTPEVVTRFRVPERFLRSPAPTGDGLPHRQPGPVAGGGCHDRRGAVAGAQPGGRRAVGCRRGGPVRPLGGGAGPG